MHLQSSIKSETPGVRDGGRSSCVALGTSRSRGVPLVTPATLQLPSAATRLGEDMPDKTIKCLRVL